MCGLSSGENKDIAIPVAAGVRNVVAVAQAKKQGFVVTRDALEFIEKVFSARARSPRKEHLVLATPAAVTATEQNLPSLAERLRDEWESREEEIPSEVLKARAERSNWWGSDGWWHGPPWGSAWGSSWGDERK